MDEMYEDKAVAEASLSLFQKYRIPNTWSTALGSVLFSNRYFRIISESQKLSEHLIISQGDKVHADSFEV
jgi:hypothetical protein